MDEPLETVIEERLVDDLVKAPARLGIAHREDEPVTAAAKVETAFGLDRHRQLGRQAGDRLGLQELTAERADRQLDPELPPGLGRPWPGRDDEYIGSELRGVVAFTHLHPTRGRATDELARHCGRVSDPVLPADDGAGDVVGAHAGRGRGRHHAHSLGALELSSFLELGEASLGGGQEEVADLIEEWRPQLFEEADARLRELDLRRGRELLPNAPHRLRRRTAGNRTTIAEHDSFGTELRQVVGDRRAGSAGSGYNDPSH